jgi:peptide/nickel transport system substrate-binding protein
MISKSRLQPMLYSGSPDTRLPRTALFLLTLLSVACGGLPTPFPTGDAGVVASFTPPPASAPAIGMPTPVPTPTPTWTATPMPTLETAPNVPPVPAAGALTFCTGGEPSYVARLVRAATQDGPFDIVGYDLRPVLLEKVPSLADGDAVITAVEVRAGALVLDDAGTPVRLAPGARVRPTGCRASGCAVTVPATGGPPLFMDQLTVNFRMRPAGWEWSDGTPLSAHDSVRAFEQSEEPAAVLKAATARYAALNDLEIVWVGLPGYLPATYAQAFWTPLSPVPALREPHEGRSNTGLPLVYGPYAPVAWEAGHYIQLQRNPRYLRPDGTPPAFSEVWFRFWPKLTAAPTQPEAQDALDALASGACDILTPDLDLEQVLPRLEAMAQAGDARIVVAPVPTWEQLTFNLTATPPLFADARARQAVAYCLDRKALMIAATHAYGVVLDTYLPPEHPLAVEVERYPYLPDQGTALLSQAGWHDGDGDGVREATGVRGVPDGTPFRVRYLTTACGSSDSTSPDRKRVAEQVAEYLSVCGIAVDIVTLPRWEFHAQHGANPLISGQFDLAQFAWAAELAPPCDLYMTGAIPAPPPTAKLLGTPAAADVTREFPAVVPPVIRYGWTGTNVGGFSEVAYDAACALATWSLPGEPDYVRAHHRAQRLFAELLPALPLYRPVTFLATRSDLEGVLPDPLAAETWHIEGFR